MTQEALDRIAGKLRRAGANLPAPEVTGTIEGSVVTGLCIALALVESETEALAQQEQEPVAWLSIDSIGERYLCFDKPLDNDPVKPLYTTTPQRTWVELTDDEIALIHADNPHPQGFARAILAKSKEKNT
jgi:hypothetical protein